MMKTILFCTILLLSALAKTDEHPYYNDGVRKSSSNESLGENGNPECLRTSVKDCSAMDSCGALTDSTQEVKPVDTDKGQERKQ